MRYATLYTSWQPLAHGLWELSVQASKLDQGWQYVDATHFALKLLKPSLALPLHGSVLVLWFDGSDV